MKVKESYIHIQQGLQQLAAFVYADIQLKELDLFVNQGISKFIELVYPDIDDDASNPERRNEAYSKIQASVDDLRVLEVNGYTSTISDFTTGTYKGKKLTLPANYRHLLNDRCIVSPLNCATTVTAEVPNRLSKRQNLFNILDSNIHRTHIESPISVLTPTEIQVYNTFKGNKIFDINSIYIDYLKKPDTVAYGSSGDTDLQFPDHVCYKIIETIIIYISIVIEKNPNTIELLKRQ